MVYDPVYFKRAKIIFRPVFWQKTKSKSVALAFDNILKSKRVQTNVNCEMDRFILMPTQVMLKLCLFSR